MSQLNLCLKVNFLYNIYIMINWLHAFFSLKSYTLNLEGFQYNRDTIF